MVVVVRDKSSTGALLLALTILSLITIVVLIFIILYGKGNVMVIAIPGFPPESIAAGLALGTFLIVLSRSVKRNSGDRRKARSRA